MTVDLLWCDGTWTRPSARSAVSEALRRALAGTAVRFTYVDYPASFGPATGVTDVSYGDSVAAGMVALRDAVRATPNRAVVGGYSQGAAVAMKWAAHLPARNTTDLDVLAVAALGNPHQPVHVGRAGIAGPLSVPRTLLSVYAPGDPIADLPLGSPLRSIADVTEWMSLRSPEAGKRWAADLVTRLAEQRAQAWWAPWRWSDLASAGQYAAGYLGTAHTLDYLTGGHVDRLARQIVAVAS